MSFLEIKGQTENERNTFSYYEFVDLVRMRSYTFLNELVYLSTEVGR